MERGEPAYVHCWGGIGTDRHRRGLVPRPPPRSDGRRGARPPRRPLAGRSEERDLPRVAPDGGAAAGRPPLRRKRRREAVSARIDSPTNPRIAAAARATREGEALVLEGARTLVDALDAGIVPDVVFAVSDLAPVDAAAVDRAGGPASRSSRSPPASSRASPTSSRREPSSRSPPCPSRLWKPSPARGSSSSSTGSRTPRTSAPSSGPPRPSAREESS